MDAGDSLLTRLPVLRILVPLVAGILCAEWLRSYSFLVPLIVTAFGMAIYAGIRMMSSSPMAAIGHRPFYIIPVAMLSFSLGWASIVANRPSQIDLKSVNGHAVCGKIADIAFKDFSMRMTVELKNIDSSATGLIVRPPMLLLTTRHCDYSLHPGDLIAFVAHIEPITNTGNPDEIDYQKIMERRGISYTQHLSADYLNRYGTSSGLLEKIVIFRGYVQDCVLSSNLNDQAKNMIVAMILGNDTFVDQDTRSAFSCAGISHILALSGLHVGIVAGLIWLLFWPLDFAGGKKLRLILTLVALVAFDVFTGLSPSVVRATIMIAFVFVAFVFSRRSDPLNALLSAALFILTFSPQSVFGVGFQLSFVTVAALLVYAPRTGVINYRNPVTRYLGTLLITSAISMLATVILTAYYFHVVSLVSVLTNLLVLPVIPFLMAFGAFYVGLVAAGFRAPLITSIANSLSDYVQLVASHLSAHQFTHIDGVSVTVVDVIAFYLVIVLFTLWFKRRSIRWAIAALLVVSATVTNDAIAEFKRPKSGFYILNDFNTTPLLVYSNHEAIVWCPDEMQDFDINAFRRHYLGFLSRNGIDSIIVIGESGKRFAGGFVSPPYAYMHGKSIVAAGHGHWKNAKNRLGIQPDLVVVTREYHGTALRLFDLYHPALMVLSGDIYGPTEDQLRRECLTLHLPFWSVRRQGAYLTRPAATK